MQLINLINKNLKIMKRLFMMWMRALISSYRFIRKEVVHTLVLIIILIVDHAKTTSIYLIVIHLKHHLMIQAVAA